MNKALHNLWIAILQNPKTSITGLVGGVATILASLNIIIPKDLTEGIGGLTIFLIGLVSRDGNAPSLNKS